MSREVLIALIVLGLVANVGLLAAVAWLNHRALLSARARPAGDPGAPIAADDADRARLLAAGAGLVDRDWLDVRTAEVGTAPGEARPGAEAGRAGGHDSAAARTEVVVTLRGSTPDDRVVRAVSTALRGAVRPSDEVVELPGGHVRVSLATDGRGGEAFVRRARGVVRPWLATLGPDLDLRIERTWAASRQGAAR